MTLFHLYNEVPASVETYKYNNEIKGVLKTAIKHYNTNDRQYYDALIKQYPKPEDVKDKDYIANVAKWKKELNIGE